MFELEVSELAACKIDELRDKVGLGYQIIPALVIREALDEMAGSGVGMAEREDRFLHVLFGIVLKLVDLLGDAGDHDVGVVPAGTTPPEMVVQMDNIRLSRHFPLPQHVRVVAIDEDRTEIMLIVAPAPHCGPAI